MVLLSQKQMIVCSIDDQRKQHGTTIIYRKRMDQVGRVLFGILRYLRYFRILGKGSKDFPITSVIDVCARPHLYIYLFNPLNRIADLDTIKGISSISSNLAALLITSFFRH